MNHDTHLRWIFNKSMMQPNKMGQLSIFIMYDHPTCIYLKHTFRILIHNISRQLEKRHFTIYLAFHLF